MDALARRIKASQQQARAALAARPLGSGAFGEVARYVDAALASFRGQITARQERLLALPPVPCFFSMVEPGLLRFSPTEGPSAVAWTVTAASRPLLEGPDWEPALRKTSMNRWAEASPRLQREVRSYSSLERDDFVLVETDTTVQVHCEQVRTNPILVGDRQIEARIDRWILYANGRETAREIKYVSALSPDQRRYPETIRQLVAELLFAMRYGVTFEVATERWIRRNPVLLANSKTVVRYGDACGLNERIARQVEEFVQSQGRTTIAAACAAVDSPMSAARYAVHNLLFWGRLEAEMMTTTLLSDHTEIAHGPAQDL